MLPMSRMSTMLLPAPVALLGSLLAAGCEPSAEVGSRPAMACPEPEVDFGRVFEGSVLEHEFELEALAPLQVTAVRSDCGCTVARLDRLAGSERLPYGYGDPLERGTKLVLRARYDTLGHAGTGVRSVFLSTEAGETVALTLAADVRPWLVAEPPELGLTRLLEGETGEVGFRVRSAGKEPFLLVATHRALPDAVGVELLPQQPDGAGRSSEWTVTVRAGADAPRGPHAYPIELESDVPVPPADSEESGSDAPERRFTVAPVWNLHVLGPVALSTPNIEFGLVRPDETVARTVRLESFDPGFTLAEPRVRLEPLKGSGPLPLARTARVRSRPVPGSPAYDIEVLLAGLDPEVSGRFLAKLVVETGHPRLPRLEALVSGVSLPESAGGAR
jgi:uncharacterized protein DUF1573